MGVPIGEERGRPAVAGDPLEIGILLGELGNGLKHLLPAGGLLHHAQAALHAGIEHVDVGIDDSWKDALAGRQFDQGAPGREPFARLGGRADVCDSPVLHRHALRQRIGLGYGADGTDDDEVAVTRPRVQDTKSGADQGISKLLHEGLLQRPTTLRVAAISRPLMPKIAIQGAILDRL